MTEKTKIILPHNGWTPRPDQRPLWDYLVRGGKRADVVAHRRWGKDEVSLHWAAISAHRNPATYWHMLPEAAQARKAIWEAVNPMTGRRRIDEAFPKELRDTTREQDMLIRFKNGSTWQVLGSDNFDSLVGSPPFGVVFSEWSLARPDAWNYIRPILLQNGGWASFIWTPRGRNHATRAFESRERDPEWFTARIPATITPVFTPEQLAKEKQDLIDEAGSEQEGEAKYNTEYMVDFDAAVPGAYYATHLVDAQKAGRIGSFPYQHEIKVDTAWDLGIDDYTAIWFIQRINETRFNVIDFFEASDVGLDTIVAAAFGSASKEATTMGLEEVAREALKGRPWLRDAKFGMHYLPHDVMVRELGAGGRSRRETLFSLGVKPIRVGIARNPEERVNASRRALPYCYFNTDSPGVVTGVEHMKQYTKKFNRTLNVYVGPLHNEHSHAADGFGEFAVNARLPTRSKPSDPTVPPDRKDWLPKIPSRSQAYGSQKNKLHWKVA